MPPSYDRRPTGKSTLTIAVNTAISDASGDLSMLTPVGIMLSGWDSASVSFAVSYKGDPAAGDYIPLCDEDGEYIVSDPSGINSGNVYIRLDPAVFAGVRRLKVRSGTVGSTVNQTTARTVVLVVREVA